jgi:dTDP-4-dehydrorhamnose reductase
MIVIYGSNGFVGRHITLALTNAQKHYLCSKTRIYEYSYIKEELKLYNAKTVICAAGFPTPTNIDYYESKKSDLLLTNTVGVLVLAKACEELDIHLIVIMSGCIFSGEFVYNDKSIPDFTGSYYSKNRVETESLLSAFNNVCIVRIRMPIDYLHPKSLITKLLNFSRVTNISNSVTILEDCMPKILDIISLHMRGTVNLVNEGSVTNAMIMWLYKKFINPKKSILLTRPELIKGAPRSNCVIRPSSQFGRIPDARSRLTEIFKDMKKTVDIYC